MCSVSDCSNLVVARGWCGKHYQRWVKFGDPDRTKNIPRGADPAEHLDFYLPDRPEEGCWQWQGTLSTKGQYAVANIHGKQVKAHVLAYEKWMAPVPEGLELDHLCKNPQCCRPAHLEPVTPHENRARSNNPSAINGRKTHCIHGHEFTPENTLLRRTPGNGTGRTCRTCISEVYPSTRNADIP